MQFLTPELRSLKSITKQEDFVAVSLLGTPPEFIDFKYPVSATVKAELIYSEVLVSGKVSTTLGLECCRCLKKFEKKITGEFKQSFALEAEVIEVDSHIKETILLDLPLKTVCQESCKGICATCGTDRNVKDCHCETHHDNPQWDELNKLKFK